LPEKIKGDTKMKVSKEQTKQVLEGAKEVLAKDSSLSYGFVLSKLEKISAVLLDENVTDGADSVETEELDGDLLGESLAELSDFVEKESMHL